VKKDMRGHFHDAAAAVFLQHVVCVWCNNNF